MNRPSCFSAGHEAVGAFHKGMQFVAPNSEGINMDEVSAFDYENEVAVD